MTNRFGRMILHEIQLISDQMHISKHTYTLTQPNISIIPELRDTYEVGCNGTLYIKINI